MQFHLLQSEFAITRLDAGAPVPEWARGEFVSITRTTEELSIVCEAGAHGRRGYRGLKIAGPLDFSLVGVMASVAQTLARAEVPILAISTFDTDYIFFEELYVDRAIEALERDGHVVRRS
jgi:uncharacterized protein